MSIVFWMLLGILVQGLLSLKFHSPITSAKSEATRITFLCCWNVAFMAIGMQAPYVCGILLVLLWIDIPRLAKYIENENKMNSKETANG